MKEYFTEINVLNTLIKNEEIIEYIHDYYAAVNKRLSILYESGVFYIAEDNTFQPWLSIMGQIPHNMTDMELSDLLISYVMISRYNEIAKKLQTKHEATFAKKFFYFYAKVKYELE